MANKQNAGKTPSDQHMQWIFTAMILVPGENRHPKNLDRELDRLVHSLGQAGFPSVSRGHCFRRCQLLPEAWIAPELLHGGPYITTSYDYDYDAPLDEYGNNRQPKYGHLKELHTVLKFMEKILFHGEYKDSTHGKNVTVTKYTSDGSSGGFASNKFHDRDVNVTLDGATHVVPVWSVSILPDCKKVAFNSAKMKTQTSVMVKKPSMAEPQSLTWSWMPENLKPFMTDKRGIRRQQQTN